MKFVMYLALGGGREKYSRFHNAPHRKRSFVLKNMINTIDLCMKIDDNLRSYRGQTEIPLAEPV
jgi:hypothetical protein